MTPTEEVAVCLGGSLSSASRSAAEAAIGVYLRALERSGYVIVPREPTREMLMRVQGNGGKQARVYADAAWPDMLAAAPKFL